MILFSNPDAIWFAVFCSFVIIMFVILKSPKETDASYIKKLGELSPNTDPIRNSAKFEGSGYFK